MTNLKYLENSELFQDKAITADVFENEDGRTVIVLDGTIFYPQGGGQQYDTGEITSPNAQFDVEEVRFIDGEVYHIGKFTKGAIGNRVEVSLNVNEERRRLNARLHTAGHLVDSALRSLDIGGFVPAKGYHFPDGPYVEYQYSGAAIDEKDLKEKLDEVLLGMIDPGFEVNSMLVSFDELKKMCEYVPEYLPKDKPIRAVTVWENYWIPCGGTHVKNINEIGDMKISKIGTKSGNIRISYNIN